MTSRKRGRPDDDDSTPPQPPTVSPPLCKERVLAPREMFLTIRHRARDVHEKSISALAEPTGVHALAHTRVTNSPVLSDVQRASLVVLLTILNDYFPGDPMTTKFTLSIACTSLTDGDALAALADTIDKGLLAFRAKCSPHDTPSSNLTPLIARSPTSPPLDCTPTTTTIDPPATGVPKRALGSKQSGWTTASHKIRAACKARDGYRCRLCKLPYYQSAHIIPFSAQDSRDLEFWSFVALFRGANATATLKATALAPDRNNSYNLMNMIQLCPNCHYLFSRQWVSLIPQIIEDPAFVFPYDPRVVTQYDVVVEFPAGSSVAPIPVMEDDGTGKWMRPGYVFTLRTPDPATLPLPHPLLLQLNVLCSRMVAMRATIGYPVILDDE